MNNPVVTGYLYGWLMNAIGVLTGQKTGKTSNFTSFSDFMNSMGSSGFNGNITDPIETKAALWFYNYWGNYLQPEPGILSFLWTVLGWGVIALYNITAALENVFNNLFKLFGLFDYLSDPSSLIGKFYQGFQILGIAIFTMLLVVQITVSVFGKPFKYKDALLHFLLVTFVCAVLPATITKVSSIFYQDLTNKQTGIENITGNANRNSSKEKNKDTLAIQPVKNNVTDVLELVRGDFNTKKFPLDKYGNIKGNGTYNSITDDPNKRMDGDFITRMNFGATLGATDTETLDNLEKKANLKGIKGLFLHYPSDTGAAIKSVNEHRFLSGANLAEKVYPRYKTNFLAIYAQYTVLIILLALMCVKLVTSIFELLITGLIAPIQGYSSVTSHSKFKELLLTITGTIAGIYFEAIIMRIVLEIMRDFPTIAMTVYDTNGNVVGKSATFFSGLGPFQSALASIVVYLGLFFGAMRGVTIVERWLGVSVGQNDMAQQVMGAMIATNAISQVGKGVGNTALGLAGAGGTALSAVKQAPNIANAAAGGLGKVSGMVEGVRDSFGKQGVGATLRGGLLNADDAVSGKIQQGVDNFKEKQQQGKDSASAAFKNNYPTDEDMLKHPNAYYDDSYDGVDQEPGPGSVPPDDPTTPPTDGGGDDNMGGDPPVASDPTGERATSDPQGGLSDGDRSAESTPEQDRQAEIPSTEAGGLQQEVPQESAVPQEGGLSEPNSDGAIEGAPGTEQNGLEPQDQTAKTSAQEGGLSSRGEMVSKTEGQNSPETTPGLNNQYVQEMSQGVTVSKDTSASSVDQVVDSPNGVQTTTNDSPVLEETSIQSQTSDQRPQTAQKAQSTPQQPVQNTQPTHFQKASANYQQANQTLSQGMQYMTSGRSHIRGKQADDDE